MTQLKQRAVSAVGWSAAAQVVMQFFNLTVSILVARLVGPGAYGMVGMILVFTSFANLFQDLGLGPAIIQRKDLEDRHLDAAFWANVVIGMLMTALIVGAAPLISGFYKEPNLTPLAVALAFRFTLDSLNIVQMALLNRTIRFHIIARIQVAATVTAGLLGVAMALRGFGAWSIVAQTLANSLVVLALSWLWSDWRPGLRFEFGACRELMGYSSRVLAFNIINYWCRALDQMLIGRYTGAASLGLYSRAYTLMMLPVNQVGNLVGRVMFPTLASIQDDLPRVKSTYLKAITMIALVAYPMMTGLFVVADHVVLALLTPQWSGVVPFLKILCWVGLIQSVDVTSGTLFLSQGRTDMYLRMGAVSCSICVAMFVLGIQWGALGVAWAYLIYNIFSWPLVTAYAGAIVNLKVTEVFRELTPVFVCSMAMAAGVWGVDRLLPAGWPHWAFLAVEVPAGAGLYWWVLRSFRVRAYEQAHDVWQETLGKRLGRGWLGRAASENVAP